MLKFTIMLRDFGLHLSIAKGFGTIPEIAQNLGITAAQIHPTAPQRWNTKPIPDSKAEELIRAVKKYKSPLHTLALHAIYLINLAQSDKQKFHLSKVSIQKYLEFCELIKMFAKNYGVNFNCIGTVVHPGSAKHFSSNKDALDRVVYGINWILEHTDKGTILLETSAGSGQIIGDTFEELSYIRKHSIDQKRIFFCIDTQHMWASGYDFINNTEKVIQELDKNLGLENIKLIHLNNSLTEFNSKKDRHANLKEGVIPFEGLQKFINYKALKHIPVILETPACKNIDTSKQEVQNLKELLNIK